MVGMATSAKHSSLSLTPVAEWKNALPIKSSIWLAASSGGSPAGRILDMQFRFESIAPTRGRQVI